MVPLEIVGQLRRPAHRWPGWRLGIRARLFLLALVTLSPLVGVLVFQDYYHLVAARQRADADATRLAQIKAGDVDQNLLAIETQLVALRPVIAADRALLTANEARLPTRNSKIEKGARIVTVLMTVWPAREDLQSFSALWRFEQGHPHRGRA